MTTSLDGLEEKKEGDADVVKASFWRGRVFNSIFSFFLFWMSVLTESLKLITATPEKFLPWEGWLARMKNDLMSNEGVICLVDDLVEKEKIISVRENVGATEVFPVEVVNQTHDSQSTV